ncbi:MAG: Ig-like domain-containing protein [Oscillospiraceae bacterium]|jgi:GH24 family phage-related lysozyme (muramidase)/uncharacterized protein YjdB|nr:Ig-like domain-containing protein [Oscillospiraceae bacterium]
MKNTAKLLFKRTTALVTAFVLLVTALAYLTIAATAKENALNGKLYFSQTVAELQTGNTMLLHAFVNSNSSVQNSVSFVSTNSNIAGVNAQGIVTGVAPGTATITAVQHGTGQTANCVVTVKGQPIVQPTTVTVPTTTTVPITTTVPVTTTVPITTTVPVTTNVPTTTTVPVTTTVPTTTTPPPSYPVTLSEKSAKIYTGNLHHVAAKSAGAITYKSSNTEVATVNASGIVTAVKAGSATITASSSSHSATCTLTVVSGTTVNINKTTATFPQRKTYRNNSKTSGVKWKSGDTSIASVNEAGYIEGVKAGTTVVTAYTSSGAATCLVTVQPLAPIRYAYATPNSAAPNTNITFTAITDKTRTAVKFELTSGSTKYTVNATAKTDDYDTYVWTGSSSEIAVAGEYTLKAYSQNGSASQWQTCADAQINIMITNTAPSEYTFDKHSMSTAGIDFIKDSEGLVKILEEDQLVAGVDNIGHGVVINIGDTFYNDLTAKTSYGYMIKELNDNYMPAADAFFAGNNIKANQYQYDALISFYYNLGTRILNNDSDLSGVFLNALDTASSITPATGVAGFVNSDSVRLRSSTSTSNSTNILKTMEINTTFTFEDSKIYTGSGYNWYKIKLTDGTVGYIASDYASVAAFNIGAKGVVTTNVNMRSAATTGSNNVIKTLGVNTSFTFADTKIYSGSGYSWYKIKLTDGTVGYIVTDYAELAPERNLSKVNKTNLIKYWLQYHHASKSCVLGLLYRRIDEVEMFLYGDYVRDGRNNKKDFSFTCASNSGFYIDF